MSGRAEGLWSTDLGCWELRFTGAYSAQDYRSVEAEKIEAPHLGALNLNIGSYSFRALPWGTRCGETLTPQPEGWRVSEKRTLSFRAPWKFWLKSEV